MIPFKKNILDLNLKKKKHESAQNHTTKQHTHVYCDTRHDTSGGMRACLASNCNTMIEVCTS